MEVRALTGCRIPSLQNIERRLSVKICWIENLEMSLQVNRRRANKREVVQLKSLDNQFMTKGFVLRLVFSKETI